MSYVHQRRLVDKSARINFRHLIDFNKKNTLKIESNIAKLRNWPDVTILVIHGVRLEVRLGFGQEVSYGVSSGVSH